MSQFLVTDLGTRVAVTRHEVNVIQTAFRRTFGDLVSIGHGKWAKLLGPQARDVAALVEGPDGWTQRFQSSSQLRQIAAALTASDEKHLASRFFDAARAHDQQNGHVTEQ